MAFSGRKLTTKSLKLFPIQINLIVTEYRMVLLVWATSAYGGSCGGGGGGGEGDMSTPGPVMTLFISIV